jgi:hypothetical protein
VEGAEPEVDYVDTSAYEVYEKQEGDFVEGEPGDVNVEEAIAPLANGDDSVPR